MIPPRRRQHQRLRPLLRHRCKTGTHHQVWPQPRQRLLPKALDLPEVIDAAEATTASTVFKDDLGLARPDARHALQGIAVGAVEVDGRLYRRRCKEGYRKSTREQAAEGQGAKTGHGRWLRNRQGPVIPALAVCPCPRRSASAIRPMPGGDYIEWLIATAYMEWLIATMQSVSSGCGAIPSSNRPIPLTDNMNLMSPSGRIGSWCCASSKYMSLTTRR